MHKLLEELKVPHEYEEQEAWAMTWTGCWPGHPRGLIFAAKHFKEPAAREPAAREAKVPR